MIKGTGIDIVEVERIKKAMEKNDRFKQLVFAAEEIEYCETKGSGFESYAGKFAAKEAFLKAVGTGWRDNTAFHEIVILNDDLGKPFIQLKGATKETMENQKDTLMHVSISHSKHYATAMVIIEENK